MQRNFWLGFAPGSDGGLNIANDPQGENQVPSQLREMIFVIRLDMDKDLCDARRPQPVGLYSK
jgi:hypothetical protein